MLSYRREVVGFAACAAQAGDERAIHYTQQRARLIRVELGRNSSSNGVESISTEIQRSMFILLKHVHFVFRVHVLSYEGL